MSNTKEIQRRIKSVNNTKKITRAMEMVAAAKMRKAVEAVLKTRTYANLSWTTVLNIAKSVEGGRELHPLLCQRKEKDCKHGDVKKVALIIFASNRGLCGGFNSSVIKKMHESVEKHHKTNGEKIETEVIGVGKKSLSAHSRYGYNITAEFSKNDTAYEIKEVTPIAKLVVDKFLSGEYDKVMAVYTDYVSASKQVPRVKQLLPVDLNAEDDHLGIVGGDTRLKTDKDYIAEKQEKYLKEEKDSYVFSFEPSEEEVLDEMIPRLIEIQLFQALLESNASEHSARMAAMHQATDAAKDLVKQLTLYYNKARQAAITSEIAEISSGAESLKN